MGPARLGEDRLDPLLLGGDEVDERVARADQRVELLARTVRRRCGAWARVDRPGAGIRRECSAPRDGASQAADAVSARRQTRPRGTVRVRRHVDRRDRAGRDVASPSPGRERDRLGELRVVADERGPVAGRAARARGAPRPSDAPEASAGVLLDRRAGRGGEERRPSRARARTGASRSAESGERRRRARARAPRSAARPAGVSRRAASPPGSLGSASRVADEVDAARSRSLRDEERDREVGEQLGERGAPRPRATRAGHDVAPAAREPARQRERRRPSGSAPPPASRSAEDEPRHGAHDGAPPSACARANANTRSRVRPVRRRAAGSRPRGRARGASRRSAERRAEEEELRPAVGERLRRRDAGARARARASGPRPSSACERLERAARRSSKSTGRRLSGSTSDRSHSSQPW